MSVSKHTDYTSGLKLLAGLSLLLLIGYLSFTKAPTTTEVGKFLVKEGYKNVEVSIFTPMNRCNYGSYAYSFTATVLIYNNEGDVVSSRPTGGNVCQTIIGGSYYIRTF